MAIAERAAQRPRILAVGAYDMDNLGDVLFLLVLRRRLAPVADIIAGAPFGWPRPASIGPSVVPFGPVLDSERVDAIWTVGGDLRDLSLEHAFHLSAPERLYEEYQRRPEPERAVILRRLAGPTAPVHAYIPQPAAYPLNEGTPTVLSSATLAPFFFAPAPARRAALDALFRGLSLVSVRDRESSSYLDALGVPHRLAPDMVHALPVLWPAAADPVPGTAILQINGTALTTAGIDAVAEAIVRSAQLRGRQIQVVLAGTFRGGDSASACGTLVSRVRALSPGTDIRLILERRPLALVQRLRRAEVIIATSLHLRIAASAYGVARVGLAGTSAKVAQYASLWDPVMPVGVELTEMDEAVEMAIAATRDRQSVEHTRALSDQALRALDDLASDLLSTLAAQTPADVRARALTRRRLFDGLNRRR